MELIVAEKKFEVGASQDRVWRLIGKVIFSSLAGMENVEILDENNFRAMLRVQIAHIRLSLALKGEMVDMLPPQSFGVKLEIKGLKGLVRMSQKVTMAITSVANNRSIVTCTAAAEGMGILGRILFLGQAKLFAQSTFDAIEKRLKEVA
jgi:carbon monoxide dehydrogenase subunit G